MTKERSKALPDVPTGIEQGTPNLEAYTWNAIFLPKGAPADIVKKLNDAAVQAMKTPSVKERLEGLGAVIVSEDRARLRVRDDRDPSLGSRPFEEIAPRAEARRVMDQGDLAPDLGAE